MNFKEWLNEEVKFASWMHDGTITAYVDGRKYVYDIDTIFHDELKRLAKFRPYTALNKIKKLIKFNKGRQIEPVEQPIVQRQPTLF